MISDLEIMRKKIEKDASLLSELKAVNESKNETDRSRDFCRVHLGGNANLDIISGPANAGESPRSRRDATIRKLAP
ncbi:hypothetical protein [Paracoccus sp. ME4]|uniref:hypothetical protein n=1 Tax=Paracoccus sp. ME4 TaxID=3138066 RepID=UPI00398AC834